MNVALRYEIEFLEVGADRDHVHFLVQSVPTCGPKKIVQTIKSITARGIFRHLPEVKRQSWGGEFWSDGYFISTVGAHGSEEMIKRYIKEQGRSGGSSQLTLF